MKVVTDILGVIGVGRPHTGTRHFREMKISSIILLVLIPIFVFTFGSAVGGSYEEVKAHFAQPFPAIICALTFIIGFSHFKSGARVAIEDYADGITEKILITGVNLLSYFATVLGLVALAKFVF